MSLYDMMDEIDPEKLSEKVYDNNDAMNCLLSMGETSEVLSEKNN